MATLTITINLDNDAFATDYAGEIAEILRPLPILTTALVNTEISLKDSNGNKVGTAYRDITGE